MANALSSWPESLRRVELSAFDVRGSWVREDFFQKVRTVSTKLARSSQQLSHLWVDGLRWDAFFADGKDLYWPRMERLTFCYDYATIRVREEKPLFLFTYQGVDLNYENLDQMYAMAARAAMNMPQLRHLLVCAKRWYTIPGYSHCIFYKVTNGRGMLSWAEAETYSPSSKVIELWSAVARKHTRHDLIIQGVRGYPQFMDRKSPEHRATWYDIPPSRLYVPKYWNYAPWSREKQPWSVSYRSTEEEETEVERREYSIAVGPSRDP
ncbi:hypothetical protein BJ166DRAFT_611216 [Pestalotiopsis sp. NC0098]|nr:hypothetical protein BJ166DRAFT_611216 [Pestalotiopsis sp. NC0098]